MVFFLLIPWGGLGSPLVGLSGALGNSGILVALGMLDCMVVDMCSLWWVCGWVGMGDIGWVVGWVGWVGERVGGRVGSVPGWYPCMGVLWGVVSVEVLCHFLGYVLFVPGSRFVGRGGDDGWVPCEKGVGEG